MRHASNPSFAIPAFIPTAIPCILTLAVLAAGAPAVAGAPARMRDEEPVAESITVTAPIEEVTLYQGRAMISRIARSPAGEGLFELRFERLPLSLDPESLQATVRSARGGAKLLDVRFEESFTTSDVTNNPELRDAIAALEAARREGEALAMKMAAINDRYTLLNAIRQKTATESAKDFGSKDLDPEALARQIAFIDSTQAQLIADRIALDADTRANTDELNALTAKVKALGGQTKFERTAVVSVGQSIADAAEVTLRYLVEDAGWEPRYAVRADADAGSLVIEYDAEIHQSTGEDWNDVRLTLSTAQPTNRAAPNSIAPAFVDVFVPPPAAPAMEAMYDAAAAPRPDRAMRRAPGGEGGGSGGAVGFTGGGADMPVNAAYKAAFDDSRAVRSGTVVSYAIPRAISVASDAQRARRQRIATIDTKPSFTHVARPLVESAVYLRAIAANDSGYQFLAGPATVFLGGDSVGSTVLPNLAAGAEMTFWLGTDPRVEAKRVLVKKSTGETGVFSKSDETRWDFRVDLASTNPQPVSVELVDRVPVSRNEQIRIELKDLSQPLATDAKFTTDERPQGYLKWIVQLPGQAQAGKPSKASVSWSVIASKPKDVQTTPIPD